MPEFTPADPHFLAWWRYFVADEPDPHAYVRQSAHWALSFALQQKLGAIPGPDP